jgi:hypothetical protein
MFLVEDDQHLTWWGMPMPFKRMQKGQIFSQAL